MRRGGSRHAEGSGRRSRRAGGECRLILTLTGKVQGVGFRPALFRLCRELGLRGTIANSDRGVVADLEGARAALDALGSRLDDALPEHARVRSRQQAWGATPRGSEELQILDSVDAGGSGARVPADLSVCAACRAELADPADRRFGYALTNCTDCGPRFTITRAVPYDRKHTTMAPFPMCPACAAEYSDVEDRRYHAEPVACPSCGPRVALVNGGGEDLGGGDPLVAARDMLRGGGVLAVKGLGGYHLAVDATSDKAVARLRRRKGRPHRPLALMVRDLRQARELVLITPRAERLLTGPAAPIVLLERRPRAAESELVAPGSPRLGVMLAYTPLHLLLMDGHTSLVMTSGNRSEEPIVTGDAEARQQLARLADAFLVHGREILVACEDSVVSAGLDQPTLVVRRSRGHVPDPIPLPRDAGVILATGGQLKVCCCLTRGVEAFPGPHVGDLGSVEGEEAYGKSLEHLRGLLRLEPEAVVHDLHPDYTTTRLAGELGLPSLAVQHHHAHAAAVAGEISLDGPLLALCLDGTGYGEDGHIWGGELLLLPDPGRYERVGSLLPFGLPGGERAVRQPWRAALGLVYACMGETALDRAATLLGLGSRRLSAVRAMLGSGVGVATTTSCGRLFDAVAALCGLGREPTYEAQPALELEAAAHGQPPGDGYPALVKEGEGRLLLDPAPMVASVLNDLDLGASPADISARFHDGLASGLCRLASRAAADHGGITQVALAGGCLVNQRLCAGLIQGLTARGLEAALPGHVPPNDGGLAYGQAVVWAYR